MLSTNTANHQTISFSVWLLPVGTFEQAHICLLAKARIGKWRVACNLTEVTVVNYLKCMSKSLNSDLTCGFTPALFVSTPIMLPSYVSYYEMIMASSHRVLPKVWQPDLWVVTLFFTADVETPSIHLHVCTRRWKIVLFLICAGAKLMVSRKPLQGIWPVLCFFVFVFDWQL